MSYQTGNCEAPEEHKRLAKNRNKKLGRFEVQWRHTPEYEAYWLKIFREPLLNHWYENKWQKGARYKTLLDAEHMQEKIIREHTLGHYETRVVEHAS